MKKLLLLFFFSLLTACGSNSVSPVNENTNPVKTEARPVSGFQTVRVANNLAIELTVGPGFNVSVEGDEKLVNLVSTEVAEGTLTIRLTEKFSRGTRVSVKISMPELNELEVSGGSTALVSGVKGEMLRLRADGAAKINVSGESKALEARSKVGAVIDAEQLKVQTADVEALGVSQVTVSPAVSLKALTSGMSAVLYTGNPKVEKSPPDTTSVKKKE